MPAPSESTSGPPRRPPLLPLVLVRRCLRAVDAFPASPDRIKTLSRACLVCRQWLSSARKLLYGRVYLCLADQPTHVFHSSALLTTLLADRRFAELVNELVLHLENATALSATAAFTLFGDLSNLQSLGISVSRSKSAAAAPHLHKLKRLRHLAISGEYSTMFLRAVYSLRKLRTFHFAAAGMIPDFKYQPLWALSRFAADIDLPPSFFYKMTLFATNTLSQMVLTISDELAPPDLSFLLNLSSLSLLRAKPRLSRDELSNEATSLDLGAPERAQYMIEVLRSCRELPRLKYLTLANSLTEAAPMWTELENCSDEFFSLLPRALESLDMVVCNDLFDPDALAHLLKRKGITNPALGWIFVSFEAWGMLFFCGGLMWASHVLGKNLKVLPTSSFSVEPEAASCLMNGVYEVS